MGGKKERTEELSYETYYTGNIKLHTQHLNGMCACVCVCVRVSCMLQLRFFEIRGDAVRHVYRVQNDRTQFDRLFRRQRAGKRKLIAQFER